MPKMAKARDGEMLADEDRDVGMRVDRVQCMYCRYRKRIGTAIDLCLRVDPDLAQVL